MLASAAAFRLAPMGRAAVQAAPPPADFAAPRFAPKPASPLAAKPRPTALPSGEKAGAPAAAPPSAAHARQARSGLGYGGAYADRETF